MRFVVGSRNENFVRSMLACGLAIGIFGCCNKRMEFTGTPIKQDELSGVTVFCSIGDDSWFGGPDALGFTLTIENRASSPLNQCVLVLNNRYRAPLEKIEFYRGFARGNEPFGSDAIPPNAQLEFHGSHDNNNHQIFRDDEGNGLPRNTRVTALTLECEQGTNTWTFGWARPVSGT